MLINKSHWSTRPSSLDAKHVSWGYFSNSIRWKDWQKHFIQVFHQFRLKCWYRSGTVFWINMNNSQCNKGWEDFCCQNIACPQIFFLHCSYKSTTAIAVSISSELGIRLRWGTWFASFTQIENSTVHVGVWLQQVGVDQLHSVLLLYRLHIHKVKWYIFYLTVQQNLF